MIYIIKMNDIIFITAFKDIGRSSWKNNFQRYTIVYIQYFMNLVNNIDYKLIVYVNGNIYEFLKKINLNNNITIINSTDVDTFYKKYIDKYNEVMNSDLFKVKLNPQRLENPECWSADYNLINHSKINYIQHAKNNYPDYNYYAWIDFGCIRDIKNVPKNIDYSKLDNSKLLFQCINNPDIHPKHSAEDMLKVEYIFIAGSQFIIPNKLVEKYLELYENKLNELLTNNICDDDQSIILQIYYENKELFSLINLLDWFTLFSNYLNNT